MLSVNDLKVVLGDSLILEKVNLETADGEIVAVLGPSGSGKSTLLRAIAGLVDVTEGKVLWDGTVMNDVPVHLRRFGLMFQGFALFPHLDVAGNVGFGVPPDERENAVPEALHWVGLEGFGERRVEELSGGEKQRVALARTLAPQPRLVLLDEPLGALDRSLRERLVGDTRELLVERGVTGIVVTHDRDEAASLSDRLAIMRGGTIVQTGTLDSILAQPVDDWVAQFIQ